jgi:ABC-2 type transport system permease protein
MITKIKNIFSKTSIWFLRLRVMTVKELLQLSRDFVLIFFVLYAFTADIYHAGSGVSLQLKRASTVFQDSDRSFASRELIGRFQEPHFSIKGEISHPREGLRLLDENRAMIVLDIPSRFQESLLEGDPTSVQLQVDATNSVLGFLASSYAEQIVGEFGTEAGLKRLGLSADRAETVPLIKDDHRVWFNPNQNDAWFMSITELLNIITVFAVLLPAAAMVREKERGTVEQLLVSPLTPFQIMLPKMLAMSLVILGGTALSLFAIMKPVFHVPIKGSPLLFFIVTVLYIFTTEGLGLFVATIARNLAQAGMMTVLIVAPMIFLSGAWTPPEAMAPWMRFIMYISPLHYYIDASLGILLKGAGPAILWDSILIMTLLGSLVFGLGIWRFRRQFE